MGNYKLRNVDITKDRDVILEYNTRVNFECESLWVKEKGYIEYKKEWLRQENADRLWDLMRNTLNDDRNIAVIIETEDGTAIGYFWTMIDEISPTYLCMQINDVYIEEPYRKQGIAFDLLCYAEEHSRKIGANILRSGTGVHNSKSIALHEKAGFSLYRYEYGKLL